MDIFPLFDLIQLIPPHSSVTDKKPKLFFSNPHGNHSYFTVFALARKYDVIYLCPPLFLQLLLRRWRKPIPVVNHDVWIDFISFTCLVVFLCFRFKVFPESLYVKFFNLCACHVVKRLGLLHWYHYQDYTFLPSSLRSNLLSDTCEIIIDAPCGSANRETTLRAMMLADKIVMPSKNMSLFGTHPDKTLLLAYGGNKYEYLNQTAADSSGYLTQTPRTSNIKIAARAHSSRKGSVQFLESLSDLLDYIIESKSVLSLDVVICGSIVEPESLRLFNLLYLRSASNPNFNISFKRFSQYEYLNLLASSDLFILPTSLEGSSPAALEALWMGIPSIITRQAGIDCYRDSRHGLLLNSNDKGLIYGALVKIVSDPCLLDVYRKQLLLDRHLFSWSAYVGELSELTL